MNSYIGWWDAEVPEVGQVLGTLWKGGYWYADFSHSYRCWLESYSYRSTG